MRDEQRHQHQQEEPGVLDEPRGEAEHRQVFGPESGERAEREQGDGGVQQRSQRCGHAAPHREHEHGQREPGDVEVGQLLQRVAAPVVEEAVVGRVGELQQAFRAA